jgi:predicted Fe-S protein YdhL (DUF1289 family)
LRKRENIRNTATMSIETPCISVCQMDPRTNLCFGCGRTLAEIAGWGSITAGERRLVMAQLPARMAEAGLAPVEPRQRNKAR